MLAVDQIYLPRKSIQGPEQTLYFSTFASGILSLLGRRKVCGKKYFDGPAKFCGPCAQFHHPKWFRRRNIFSFVVAQTLFLQNSGWSKTFSRLEILTFLNALLFPGFEVSKFTFYFAFYPGSGTKATRSAQGSRRASRNTRW